MTLITLRDVTVRFRGPPLLDGVSCHIEPGQRIGREQTAGGLNLLADELQDLLGFFIGKSSVRVYDGFTIPFFYYFMLFIKSKYCSKGSLILMGV